MSNLLGSHHSNGGTEKFLFHNDDYGSGKSSLDIIATSNLGYNPVIISPWEDNSQHDFLYSVFCAIKKETNKKYFSKLAKGTKGMRWALEGTIFLTYISNYKFVSSELIKMWNLLKETWHFKMELPTVFTLHLIPIFLILILFRYIIYPIIVPYLIIYKKDFSSYYKNILLDEISYMLKINKKIILIIEDLDRLESKEQDFVFRDIASLNHVSSKYDKDRNFIGIISFDKRKMRNNVYDIKHIDDKVFKGEVFKKYSPRKSIKEYLVINNQYFEKILKNKYNFCTNTKNFRQARAIVSEWIDWVKEENEDNNK